MRSLTKALPLGGRASGVLPGTLANMPSEAVPESSMVACWAKPSNAISGTTEFDPSASTLSLISCAPFCSIKPARTTLSALLRFTLPKSDA